MDGTYTASSRYSVLEGQRLPYLQRARDCSLLTIPSLVPPQGWTSSSILYTPYQSLGARGVNNLAAKLLLTLLPPNAPFFRLTMTPEVEQQLQPGERTPFDVGLSKIEQRVITEIERRGTRVQAFEGYKHLIIGGNALLYLPRKKSPKVWGLDHYVVKRDTEGDLQEIIVKEKIALNTLPKNIQQAIEDQDDQEIGTDDDEQNEEEVDLYTWVKRGDDDDTDRPNSERFYVHQEVCGIKLPGTSGNYPEEKLPWRPLRWIRMTGEDYGRGYCEEYLGDLKSLEALEAAIVEGSAAAARILLLVNPNGLTDMDDVANAANGAIIPGMADDVHVLRQDKGDDFKAATLEIDRIQHRLEQAFLLNSSVQRNGERVTAEEIRYMAGELEDALGGVYSVMSVEFQLPLVEIILAQLVADGLPDLDKNAVQPTIITGMDALGRSQQLARLTQFVTIFGNALQNPAVAQYLDPTVLAMQIAASLGLDIQGLVLSQQQVQAQQQQAQQQQMMQKLGPNAINAVNDHSLAAQQQAADQQQQGDEGQPQQ